MIVDMNRTLYSVTTRVNCETGYGLFIRRVPVS